MEAGTEIVRDTSERSMEDEDGGGGGGGREINSLPESCVSEVIARTSPRDACRSSLVSTTFRSAADSDTVWECFLPPDYQSILAHSVSPVEYSSKKDLFFRLCDSILIDGGKMSFALDKSSGAKCYMLSARDLSIVWGDGTTPHYWKWSPHSDSRFSEVAELENVCWLEINGKIDSKVLSSKTSYAAYLIYKLVDGSFGLSHPRQEASVKVGTHLSKHMVCLQPNYANRQFPRCRQIISAYNFRIFREAPEGKEIRPDTVVPHARNDGWIEVEMGEFYNDEGEDGEVRISLMEVKGGHWKKGLIVQGLEIRAKNQAKSLIT